LPRAERRPSGAGEGEDASFRGRFGDGMRGEEPMFCTTPLYQEAAKTLRFP
jgi:hypothetical protein